MSVTNAISGIIVVGALLQIGHGGATHGDVITCAGLPRDPAGQHQRLRRFRRHPSDARHVLPKLTPCARTLELTNEHRDCGAGGLSSSRPCCSSWPWQGCPTTRRPRPATPSASAAWCRPGSHDRPGRRPGHLRPRARPDDGRHGWRRRDRPLARQGGRDDRDAGADRAVAQLRRSGGRPGRLERLPERGGGPGRARGDGPASPGALGDPLGGGVHRRLHRRGHLHGIDRGLPQALGPDQVQPVDAARKEPAQPWRAGHVRRCSRSGSSSTQRSGCSSQSR